MLLGWWRVRLSSGCPLAEGPRPPATAATSQLMAKKRRKAAAAPRPGPGPGRDRATAAGEAAAPKPRKPIEDERPPAPWGSFPLVEIVVLVGLRDARSPASSSGGSQGTVLLATGLALGVLAGLELSIREHFAGYRSHTLLLAAAAGGRHPGAVLLRAARPLPPAGRLVAAAVVGGLAGSGSPAPSGRARGAPSSCAERRGRPG